MVASERNWPGCSRAGPERLADPDLPGPRVTVTSMMFVTPIPPTSRLIAATAAQQPRERVRRRRLRLQQLAQALRPGTSPVDDAVTSSRGSRIAGSRPAAASTLSGRGGLRGDAR